MFRGCAVTILGCSLGLAALTPAHDAQPRRLRGGSLGGCDRRSLAHRVRARERPGGAHATALTISGLPEGDYRVSVDGAPVAAVMGGRRHRQIALPVGGSGIAAVAIARR